MANVSHSGLTGTDLHEPKGIASANSGDTLVANGTGSGAWTADGNKVHLTLRIPDINAAASYWVVSPVAGTISKMYAITDQAPGADGILTLEIATVAVTDSSLTIVHSGWALDTVFSSTPSAANTITKGAGIEIVNDGGASSASTACTITIEITRT